MSECSYTNTILALFLKCMGDFILVSSTCMYMYILYLVCTSHFHIHVITYIYMYRYACNKPIYMYTFVSGHDSVSKYQINILVCVQSSLKWKQCSVPVGGFTPTSPLYCHCAFV